VFLRFPQRVSVVLILICGWAGLLPSVSAQQPAAAPTPQAPASPAPASLPDPLSQTVYSTADDRDYSEDFSSLSLKSSAFFPLPPVMGQKDDNPKMPFVRERWQMMWRPADPIDLYVCKPKGASGKLPAILYLYTYPSDTNRFKSDDWCMTMTSEGFAAVGFLSAYTGDRLDMRPPSATFFKDFRESMVSTVHDVQMILDYLATRGDIDMNRIGMYGQGSGGTIAILTSSVDRRIRALDVLTPWGDWHDFFAKGSYASAEKRAKFTAPEFLAQIAPFDPVTVLPNVQAKSVRIQDVRQSGRMPDASQARLEAAAPATVAIIQYGDPASLSAHAPVGVLFGWLRNQLQPNAKPPVILAKSERVRYFPPESANALPPLVPLSEAQKQDPEKAKEQQQPQQQPNEKPPQQPNE
jgi:hypothetical protein